MGETVTTMQNPEEAAVGDRSFDPVELGNAVDGWSTSTQIIMLIGFLAVLAVLTPVIRSRLKERKKK